MSQVNGGRNRSLLRLKNVDAFRRRWINLDMVIEVSANASIVNHPDTIIVVKLADGEVFELCTDPEKSQFLVWLESRKLDDEIP